MKMDFEEKKREGSEVKKSAPTKTNKRKNKVFYCSKGQYTFDIPEYEKDGYGEIMRDENKKPKLLFAADSNGNNRHAVTKTLKFDRFPIRDPKTGRTDPMQNIGQFILKADNPRYDDILAAIVNGRKNALNGILTEEAYKKQANPVAFTHEQEKNVLKDENTVLADENERLKAELEKRGIKL